MAEPDALYMLRNHFWVGDFNRAIKVGKKLRKLNEQNRIERDEFVFRSQVGLGQYEDVLQSIEEDDSTPLSLRVVRLLATYFHDADMKEAVILTLEEWLEGEEGSNCPSLRLITFLIYLHEDRMRDGLQLFQTGSTMEEFLKTFFSFFSDF